MKKIIICLCLLFSLGCVKAEEIEIKNKNLYIFDESAQVDGAYDGIGFIAGSNVNVKSILEYGALAGADVYFNGNINKDLFTFGASVDISGSIGRDAYIAGTSVKINGNINGNLYVYASELIIGEEAIINGNVKFYGETFKTKGGSIGGTLSYYENVIYEGDTKYNEKIMKVEKTEFNFANYLKNICFDLLKSLFIFFLIAFSFPKLLKKISKNYKFDNVVNIFGLAGSGLIYLFIIPFVSTLLLVSSIGFSAGIIMLLLAGILIYVSSLFFGYLVGNLIISKLKKEHNIYLDGLIGITLITILSYIPYISIFVSMVSICAGFGILVKLVVNKENRIVK